MIVTLPRAISINTLAVCHKKQTTLHVPDRNIKVYAKINHWTHVDLLLKMLQPIQHILSQQRIILASGSPRRRQILENVVGKKISNLEIGNLQHHGGGGVGGMGDFGRRTNLGIATLCCRSLLAHLESAKSSIPAACRRFYVN